MSSGLLPRENLHDGAKEIIKGLSGKISLHAQTSGFLLRNGSGIRILWRYFVDHLYYSLIRQQILLNTSKRVAKVQAEFATYAAQGQFKNSWFDVNIVPWTVTFSRNYNRGDAVRILEIGSWEGRSTLFLLTYFTQGRLTAVDTWAGSHEYPIDPSLGPQSLEARFDENLSSCVTRLVKRKGSSLHVLPQLLDEDQKFDIIYVDGSHFADDVLADAIASWRLLKHGGVLIFDDLTWVFYSRAHDNPAWSINAFLKYREGEYEVLSVTTQLIVKKK